MQATATSAPPAQDRFLSGLDSGHDRHHPCRLTYLPGRGTRCPDRSVDPWAVNALVQATVLRGLLEAEGTDQSGLIGHSRMAKDRGRRHRHGTDTLGWTL